MVLLFQNDNPPEITVKVILNIFSFKHPHFVLSSVPFLAKPGGRVRCQYFPAVDKVLFVDDYAVGCRKDLNGILLLDTALQPPVAKPEDMVQLELPVTEVSEDSMLRKDTF